MLVVKIAVPYAEALLELANANSSLKETTNDINIYSWEWNDEGIRLGADQDHTTGFIAQDLMKTHPEAISTHESGYLMVNYKAVQNGLQ